MHLEIENRSNQKAVVWYKPYRLNNEQSYSYENALYSSGNANIKHREVDGYWKIYLYSV